MTLHILDTGLEGQSEKDLSVLAVEQFLDWEVPPHSIRLHRLGDGRWAVEQWGGLRVKNGQAKDQAGSSDSEAPQK